MKNEFLFGYIGAFIVLVLICGLIGVSGFIGRRERYHPSTYELIADRVRAELKPSKVTKLIPESDIRVVTNRDVNYWGWAVVAAGDKSVSTQWFRIVGYADKEGGLENIYDVRFFQLQPSIFQDSTLRTNRVEGPR